MLHLCVHGGQLSERDLLHRRDRGCGITSTSDCTQAGEGPRVHTSRLEFMFRSGVVVSLGAKAITEWDVWTIGNESPTLMLLFASDRSVLKALQAILFCNGMQTVFTSAL